MEATSMTLSESTMPNLILKQIIRPECLHLYHDWITTANEKEARGLQLIGAIYKHKGRKRFRNKPPSEKLQIMSQQAEFDFKRAEEMYRKSQTTTFYQSDFGQLQKSLKPQNNIFKYKKCSELDLSKSLTDLAKLFLDNWIELNDEIEFQDLTLSCLRSLYSKFHSNELEVPHSEMKHKYDGKSDWKLSKPVRMDKAGVDFKTQKKTATGFSGDGKHRKINEEKIREFEQTEFAQSLKIFKSFKIN